MIAVVVGATGAIGREVVRELVASSQCSSVLAWSRRPLPSTEWQTTFPGIDVQKAQTKLSIQEIPDFLSVKSSDFFKGDESSNEGATTVFCCLGTTRKDAGAEGFKLVDLKYVTKCAETAKEVTSLKYFGLVSAINANKDSFFLYPQVKGLAEEAASSLLLPGTVIYRPGLLQRKEKTRLVEKIGGWFLTPTSVESVAQAMVRDAVAAVSASEKVEGTKFVSKFN